MIGQVNETDVEILDGMAEGEQAIMNPRTNFAKEIAELETLLRAEQSDEPESEIPQLSPDTPKAKRLRDPDKGGAGDGRPGGEGKAKGRGKGSSRLTGNGAAAGGGK